MKKLLGIYTAPLDCRHHPEADQWEVLKPFSFVRADATIIRVPAGIITDFASTGNVPGFPQDCTYDQAAVVHDFLYQGEFLPRWKADMIFREALEAIPEVPRWKIPIMWAAVRMFGGFTYKKHSYESVRGARTLAAIPNNGNRPLWKDGKLRFV